MLPVPSKPAELESLTRELVALDSVTGTTVERGGRHVPRETLLADWIHSWFEARGVRSITQELPDGRKNVFAFVRGSSARTAVLMGHFDTVPPSPGQATTGAAAGEDAYLFGRGSLDMKSGIAVGMALTAGWGKDGSRPPASLVFVATCDEEAESKGILHALGVLAALKGTLDKQDPASRADRDAAARLTGGLTLDLRGVVNLDSTSERYPGDPDYHAWEGTIGKVLAGVYVRGYQAHAGEYFRGLHAVSLLSRLVGTIDGNTSIATPAPPPTVLKIADTKTGYNVMTSPAAWAYFNVFTSAKTPARLLQELRAIARAGVDDHLDQLNKSFREWGEAAGLPAGGMMWEVPVVTWSELVTLAEEGSGREAIDAAVESALASSRERGLDVREAAMALVEALSNLTGSRDPLVVLAFLPPYYPSIAPDGGAFGTAVRKAVAACSTPNGAAVTMEQYYPYISDMSYLRLDPGVRAGLDGITGEMPGWGRLYALDTDAIARVDLPVVNVGPHGFGAHQPEERVEREYTFTVLPNLLGEILRSV